MRAIRLCATVLLSQIPIIGSNLLIFELFHCLNRGSPFAEWSDSDDTNEEENPGDAPGSIVFASSLVVLLGIGVGCSASLSPSALGALSPL